jgi:hypothetical protein
VRDVKQQLNSLETKEDLELVHDVMLPAQGELAELVLSKLGTTIEEEIDRRNRLFVRSPCTVASKKGE